ncbi:MAG: FAD/NAD(P)-binding protein [Candidatus Eremiobacteraeota bacterium]|nr:FAD/NAD(P)-binding protein [Candidatus Eremiobacteraeota bacterium]
MIRCDAAIIGGGFSGSIVAAHLARMAGSGFSVRLFEEGEVGRGAAYGTRHREHVLNTRAHAMSAFPDDADHFVRWLGARAQADDFVSRQLYGDYLVAIARRAFERPGFAVVGDRVTAIARSGEGFALETASGARYGARAVVLATGNGTPNDDFLPPQLVAHPGYVGDPWRFNYRAVGGHVLLIGSGLTALDVLVALEAGGHRGAVHIVSRHARFPEVHAEGLAACDVVPVLDPTDARSLLRSFRQQVRVAARRGFDWRAVVDAVRPEGEALWKRLNPTEQRRFDRHLRAIWERHRHRAPGRVDAVRGRYAASGRLFVYAGRIASFAAGEVSIAPAAGSRIALRPDWIVNCTGPARNRRLFADPLLANLREAGLATPEQLGLGIRVDAAGAAIGTDGHAVPGLLVAGPLARGSRFEATAVPELPVMAQLAAANVIRTLERAVPGGTAGQRSFYMAMPVGDLSHMVAALPQ